MTEGWIVFASIEPYSDIYKHIILEILKSNVFQTHECLNHWFNLLISKAFLLPRKKSLYFLSQPICNQAYIFWQNVTYIKCIVLSPGMSNEFIKIQISFPLEIVGYHVKRFVMGEFLPLFLPSSDNKTTSRVPLNKFGLVSWITTKR